MRRPAKRIARRSSQITATHIAVASAAQPPTSAASADRAPRPSRRLTTSSARAASFAVAIIAMSPRRSTSSGVTATAKLPSMKIAAPCGTCSMVTLCPPGRQQRADALGGAVGALVGGMPSTGARRRTIRRLKTTTLDGGPSAGHRRVADGVVEAAVADASAPDPLRADRRRPAPATNSATTRNGPSRGLPAARGIRLSAWPGSAAARPTGTSRA